MEQSARADARSARFETLFRAHYHAIGAHVRQVWPAVDEDEVMSQTFEIAWRRLDEIPNEAVRGWLIGVARNCALNALRSRRRRQTYVDSFNRSRPRVSTALQDEAVPVETTDALRAAFAELREPDQEVLLLSAWDGLSGADLGAALGTSGSTAAVRLFRARERLRAAYDRQRGVP